MDYLRCAAPQCKKLGRNQKQGWCWWAHEAQTHIGCKQIVVWYKSKSVNSNQTKGTMYRTVGIKEFNMCSDKKQRVLFQK